MDRAETYYKEFDRHLMEDEKPSVFFNRKEAEGFFDKQYPFTRLGQLKRTEQNPLHHPEGNVWLHTMQVVDNAALIKEQSNDSQIFMWAALLHDIGKPDTTRIRKGRITAYNHDITGEKLSVDFLQALACPESFILKVSKLVRWHMQVFMVMKDLPFADIKTMLKEVPPYEVALLSMCDRLGRGEYTEEDVEKERDQMRKFLEKCARPH